MNKLTPEQAREEARLIVIGKQKIIDITRQNLCVQIARAVRKLWNNEVTVRVDGYLHKIKLTTEPYVPEKHKDLTFHRLKATSVLDGKEVKLIPENMEVWALEDILDKTLEPYL